MGFRLELGLIIEMIRYISWLKSAYTMDITIQLSYKRGYCVLFVGKNIWNGLLNAFLQKVVKFNWVSGLNWV